jgi:tetraacyldisaccharide 4'-kinase
VILDDAFHRTELPKDLDILLLDAKRPFGTGRLLPYGTLREPAPSIARAGAIIFTRAEGSTPPPETDGLTGDAPVFFARHEPGSLSGRDGKTVSANFLEGKDVVLFSGIARPESFERTAVELGLDPAISFRFDDHHDYSFDDIEGMLAESREGSVYVTTGKDWIKAAPLFPGDAEILRLDVRMEIPGIEELLAPVL